MAQEAVIKLAGRTEEEVAEDISSEVAHILYKKLTAVQNTYREMGYGTEELGSIMYRISTKATATLARRLETH